MKYLIIIFICFIFKSSFSQTPSVVSRSSDVVVASDGGLITRNTLRPPVYNDTTAANSSLHLLDSCGKLIFTYNDNTYWVRACNPKRWIIILNQENQVNLIQTNNGISRNGSIIQLGQIVNQSGAPATLSSSREIPLNTFAVRFTGPGYVQSNAFKVTGETTSGDGIPTGVKLYGRTATVSNNGYGTGVQEYSFVTANNGFHGYLGIQSWPYVTGGTPGALSGKFAGYVNGFSSAPLWDGSLGGTNQLPVMLGYFSGLQTQNGGILNAYDNYTSEINSVGGTTLNPIVVNHYAYYSEPFTYATNNYGIFMNGNQINYMGGSLGLGVQHGGYKLNVNGSIRQNKDSSQLVSSIISERIMLLDTITGKYKSIHAANLASSLYTFNSGLTNTSGTVQLGGTLLQNTTIDATSAPYGLFVTGARNDGQPVMTVTNTSNNFPGQEPAFKGITNGYGPGVTGFSSQYVGVLGQGYTGVQGLGTGIGISGIVDNGGYAGDFILNSTSSLGSVVPIIQITRSTNAVPSNGAGSSIDWKNPTNDASTPSQQISNQLISKFTNVTQASRTSQFILTGVNNGTTQDLLTIDGNANATFGTTNSIVGTATNNNAVAGNIGEYIESNITSGSAISLTTATAANITSISLTAGDWDVEGVITYSLSGTTSNDFKSGSNSTSATFGGDNTWVNIPLITITLTDLYGTNIPTRRYSLSGATTIYLVAQSTFSAGSVSAYGIVRARRVR